MEHDILAYLDQGSNCSLINETLFKQLRRQGCKTWRVNKKLTLAAGATMITAAISVPLHWKYGTLDQLCYKVKDSTETILLGRDFLQKTKIGLYSDGWNTANHKKIIKFVKHANDTKSAHARRARIEDPEEIMQTVEKGMSADTSDGIKSLIRCYVDKGVFSKKPGTAKGVQQEIQVAPGPPYQAPYRPMSEKQNKILDKKVEEMLEGGIIERSESDFLSAPVLIKKANIKGKNRNELTEQEENDPENYRFCLDLRPLCARNINIEAPPIPPIDYIFSHCKGKKVYSVIDLTSSFSHLEVHPNSRKYLAFRTRKGRFHYKRMCFGL